jgi:hypothetical protein
MSNFQQGNVPLPQAGGLSGSYSNKKRWDDDIKWYEIPDRVTITLRFFGPTFVINQHWIKTRTNKRFPLNCPAYSMALQGFQQGKCPVEDEFNFANIADMAKAINPSFTDQDPNYKALLEIKAKTLGLTQCIVRNSTDGRPWHPIRLGPSVYFTLIRLKNMNTCVVGGKQYTADVADPYWGRDVHIYYNSAERNPQQKYTIQLGDHTPLTEAERTYINTLHNWEEKVEYASSEEIKQALQVNGYYQLFNTLTGNSGGFNTNFDKQNGQHAQYETFLTPPPPPSYSQPQVQQVQQAPQMQMQMQVPQQMQMPAPQQQMQVPPMQMPQQQMQMPQMPQQMMASAPNMNGLTQVDTPVASSIPNSVPPPMGYQQVQQVQQTSQFQEDDGIPFDGPERTFPFKGKQLSKSEFEEQINAFASSIARGQPVQVATSGEVSGVSVLACYGSYQGDVSCIKCPLRMYCVHV